MSLNSSFSVIFLKIVNRTSVNGKSIYFISSNPKISAELFTKV